MRVLITGATGFVGSAVVRHLESLGHETRQLSRPRDWDPETGSINPERIEGFDAVIHLAGENIASSRWTEARKRAILSSRVKGTSLLAQTLCKLAWPPKVLITASAIGYYGDRGSDILTEDSPAGTGFLADVCKAWESAAAPAARCGIRVASLRIGIVLGPNGGALEQMRTVFRLGAGGTLGSGKQYMSWITIEDLCRSIEHVLTHDSLEGPVNAVAPRPVTNRAFTKALGAAVRRPALLPVPHFAARLALGELADALLFASARVVPEKLEASGFRFEDNDIRLALAKNVGGLPVLRSEQWIPRPATEVFPFFASAANLNRITPPWLDFEVLNPNVEIRTGALLDYKLRLHGIPLRWQSEILDWSPPYRFVDLQRRGPYTLWIHEHRFEPVNGGTLAHDTVWYAAPGGNAVRKLLIDRDLERIFSYRRHCLEKHFA